MNFFQSLRMYTSLVPGQASKPEVRLSLELKKEAEKLRSEAVTEWKRGETSQRLAAEAAASAKEKLWEDLTSIAAWHYMRASETFRRAAEKFSEAGSIQTRRSREYLKISGELSDMAETAKEKVRLLEQGH